MLSDIFMRNQVHLGHLIHKRDVVEATVGTRNFAVQTSVVKPILECFSEV